jgi:hypothetical protein
MKSLWNANEKYGQFFLIASSLVIGLVILLLFKVYGYDETWELWRVPVQHPQFADFRLIPGSAESYREGFEPTQKNPGDPHNRIFNYPAFWRLFFHTNITQADTVWIVTVMLGLFFAGVFLFPQNLTILDSIGMLLVIFSPAAMLLYERGNVDLIVFFLCALIVLSIDYSPWSTSALLIFAMVVKLYPLFGVTVLLKESRPRFIGLLLGCLGVLGIYVYATLESFKAAWDLTMRGREISYGTNVFFRRYSQYFADLLDVSPDASILRYGPLILVIVLIMAAGAIGIIQRESLTASSARNLAAFRMGASIYVGTFLLGNNWDYRLAFLILVMPQLLQWLRQNIQIRSRYVVIAVLGSVFISCWHFMLWFAPALADMAEFIFVLDELANWMLVAGFSYLLAASTPDWLKAPFQLLFPKKKLVQVI